MPVITLGLLILFGASEFMISSGFILAGLPVAATSYIIAQKY